MKHYFTKVFVSPILLQQQAGRSPDSRWHSWDASQWLLLAGQTIAGSARDQLGYSGMTTQRDYSWRLQPKPRDQKNKLLALKSQVNAPNNPLGKETQKKVKFQFCPIPNFTESFTRRLTAVLSTKQCFYQIRFERKLQPLVPCRLLVLLTLLRHQA